MSTSEPAEDQAPTKRTAGRSSRTRALRSAIVVVLCILGLLVAIWAGRRTIATAVINRKLAEAHVRAHYRIVDLGFGRQRLVDVTIGDPARPDLTAQWLELGTRIALDGAQVTAVRLGGLRLRASLVDGKLSLGEIDRLLPRSTGAGPFRFPAIDLTVTDGRVRLSAPPGFVDLSLTGRGRLDNGFTGHMTAASHRLAASGCTASGLSATSMIAIDQGAVTLAGPFRAARLDCADAAATGVLVDLKARMAPGMTHWRGSAAVRADRIAAAQLAVRSATGRMTFAGSAAATGGEAALTGGPAALGGVASRTLALSGRYRLSSDPGFAGRARAAGVSLPATMLAAVRRAGQSTPATPIAPLLAHAAGALETAGRNFDVAAEFGVTRAGVTLTRLDGIARSGASATFAPARPIGMRSGAIPVIAGSARIEGGGLPTATVRLAQSSPRAPISGIASILPYAAGGARLALTPVRFTSGRHGTRVSTIGTLSGPLADGRVEGLRLPIAANWDGAGMLAVNPSCTTLTFDRLAVSTLRLDGTRLPLCPTGAALVRFAGGKVDAGARVPALHLRGSLGSTPLTLAAHDTRVSLTSRGVTTGKLVVRLGAGNAVTRFDIERFAGNASAVGLNGRFIGAGGRIGKVPLLLSDADGDWRFAGGTLTVAGDAMVADSAPSGRFRPVLADTVQLRLAHGLIDATAQLVVPGKGVPVARVAIAHDLASGVGHATLDVPRLAFSEGLQPDALTPLTFGVIADVRGTVTGNARIDWTGQDVTSTGIFRTDALDLAAAFGPVTGLAGTIRFTDLLALESAPDQVATVASINPGIPITDGRFVYRTLPNSRVQVKSGHWPFAGGSLDLKPTMLDLGAPSERHLTFALQSVDAAQFLQQFDFANLSATGTFDGTLPMIFDASGGRIEGGHLKVRPGGGNIAYLGELTQKDLGVWGNLAFQALRSLDYRDLDIAMNGPLAGEMITEVRFAGISQGKGAKSNVLIRRLQKLPFIFNIRIRAPFRSLIDSAQSFYDPSRLIVQNLPALVQQQNGVAVPPALSPTPTSRPIQPAARGTLP